MNEWFLVSYIYGAKYLAFSELGFSFGPNLFEDISCDRSDQGMWKDIKVSRLNRPDIKI